MLKPEAEASLIVHRGNTAVVLAAAGLQLPGGCGLHASTASAPCAADSAGAGARV